MSKNYDDVRSAIERIRNFDDVNVETGTVNWRINKDTLFNTSCVPEVGTFWTLDVATGKATSSPFDPHLARVNVEPFWKALEHEHYNVLRSACVELTSKLASIGGKEYIDGVAAKAEELEERFLANDLSEDDMAMYLYGVKARVWHARLQSAYAFYARMVPGSDPKCVLAKSISLALRKAPVDVYPSAVREAFKETLTELQFLWSTPKEGVLDTRKLRECYIATAEAMWAPDGEIVKPRTVRCNEATTRHIYATMSGRNVVGKKGLVKRETVAPEQVIAQLVLELAKDAQTDK